MKRYMIDTVKKCRENGYVTTMLGRRRYLSAITNTNSGARNHVSTVKLRSDYKEWLIVTTMLAKGGNITHTCSYNTISTNTGAHNHVF